MLAGWWSKSRPLLVLMCAIDIQQLDRKQLIENNEFCVQWRIWKSFGWKNLNLLAVIFSIVHLIWQVHTWKYITLLPTTWLTWQLNRFIWCWSPEGEENWEQKIVFISRQKQTSLCWPAASLMMLDISHNYYQKISSNSLNTLDTIELSDFLRQLLGQL